MISNVTIIGLGAIGSLWAYYLNKAGLNVTVVGRRQLPRQITLNLRLHDGQHQRVSLDYLCQQLPQDNDLVLVTTKAYQVEQALTPHLGQLASVPIMILHNGMGSVDKLALLPSHRVLLATTSHAALKTAEGAITHTGLGQTFIGTYQGLTCADALLIAQLLNRVLPDVHYSENIERALWKKLAINCAINPLTAIELCRNGELNQDKYKTTLDCVCREISEITARLKLDLSYEEIRHSVDEVIKNTAKNYSSMHQDIANKRRTEIDFITGYVSAKAKQLALSTPQNDALYHQIKLLEKLA